MSYRQPVPPETNPAVVKRAALINKDERGKFVELQALIEALDRAIGGEGGIAARN